MVRAELNVVSFQKKIFSWWRKNRRDLPWRHTHDPYKILVSEIMLQQTQVLRVIAKYREFIQQYPTVNELSDASVADVIRIWKGMGYNRRALYLQKTAQIVIQKYNGVFPDTEKELMQLPGVGLYTARAILVFAYRQNVSMVDTNIRQILTHFFFHDIEQSPKVMQQFADSIVPQGKSWEWHQALMDFGALALSRTLPRRQAGMSHAPPTKVIPFKDTPRFIRGRIIDLLRDGQVSEPTLIRTFSTNYKKSQEFISGQIEALIREELISKHDGVLRLG